MSLVFWRNYVQLLKLLSSVHILGSVESWGQKVDFNVLFNFLEKKGRLRQFIILTNVFVNSIRQCYRCADVYSGTLCPYSLMWCWEIVCHTASLCFLVVSDLILLLWNITGWLCHLGLYNETPLHPKHKTKNTERPHRKKIIEMHVCGSTCLN